MPAVVRREESELGTSVKEVGILRVLAHHLHVSVVGQVARDVSP